MLFSLLFLYSHHCMLSAVALILIISPHSGDFWVLLSSAVQGLGSWRSPVILNGVCIAPDLWFSFPASRLCPIPTPLAGRSLHSRGEDDSCWLGQAKLSPACPYQPVQMHRGHSSSRSLSWPFSEPEAIEMCWKGVVPKLICSVFTSACVDMPCCCLSGLVRPFVTKSGELRLLLCEGRLTSFLVFTCWCWALSGTDSVSETVMGGENEWWKPFFFPLF